MPTAPTLTNSPDLWAPALTGGAVALGRGLHSGIDWSYLGLSYLVECIIIPNILFLKNIQYIIGSDSCNPINCVLLVSVPRCKSGINKNDM